MTHASLDVLAGLGAVLLAGGSWLVARAMAHVSASRERVVASFAGGVSLAFVLLDLFVELVEGAEHDLHEVVRAGPDPVHTMAILILGGTTVTFAAHVHHAHHAESWSSYAISWAPQVVYRGLVGAALVEELHESPRAFGVFWLAMVLHLGVAEHGLATAFPREHRGGFRIAGAGSMLIGAAVWQLAAPPVGIFHVLLALVAGATMLSIFREEIPAARDVRTGAFFAGLVLFGALVQARWWS